MRGLLLYLLSSVLKIAINPIGVLVGFIVIVSHKKYKNVRMKALNYYFESLAISDDQHGNVACKYIFDAIVIKNRRADKHELEMGLLIVPKTEFGDPDQTISYVVGENKQSRTLTIFGMFLAWFLNAIDPNHVEDAVIKENESN